LQAGGSATLLGAAPTADDNITIFPNPSTGLVNLSVTSEENEEVNIELRDMSQQNRLTYKQGLQHGENEVQLDVSKLPSGVYTLILHKGKQKTTKRLIIKD
jgi:hypothetical protein